MSKSSGESKSMDKDGKGSKIQTTENQLITWQLSGNHSKFVFKSSDQ
jgi:hypothetical protein